MPKFTTRDIGFALRDHMSHMSVEHIKDGDDHELIETGEIEFIDDIDVSDPNNPIIYVGDQVFVVRIVGGGTVKP